MCACACSSWRTLHLFPAHFAYYFRSAFRSAFLRSGFHSCPNTPVEPLSGVYIVTLFPTRGGFCLAVHTCMSHPLSCPSPSLILRRGISPTEREKRQLKQPGKREGRRRGQRKERGSNRENMTLLEPWQFECGSWNWPLQGEHCSTPRLDLATRLIAADAYEYVACCD